LIGSLIGSLIDREGGVGNNAAFFIWVTQFGFSRVSCRDACLVFVPGFSLLRIHGGLAFRASLWLLLLKKYKNAQKAAPCLYRMAYVPSF